MAKRKSRTLEMDPERPGTWQQEIESDQVIDPDDEEIDRVFEQFPQNEPCLEIFRIHPQGGRPLFLENVTPALFSFAYITEKYGGGKYYARAKYKNGGRVRLPFEIEGDPFPVKRTIPIETKLTPEPASSLLSTQPIEITEDNRALVALLRTMVQEMRGSEMQLLEKMKLYKELFAPAQAKSETPLETALNMFQKGIEMAATVSGEGGVSPWLIVLRELKEPLSKIVDTVHTAVNRPARPAPVPAIPGLPPQPLHRESGTSGSDPGMTATPGPQPGSEIVMRQFKAILPLLINGATKNTDPSLYVDFVLDQMPESAYAAFRDWLSQPGCLDALAAIEPGIRFQAEWWTELRTGLLTELSEPRHASEPKHNHPAQDPSAEPSADHDEGA